MAPYHVSIPLELSQCMPYRRQEVTVNQFSETQESTKRMKYECTRTSTPPVLYILSLIHQAAIEQRLPTHRAEVRGYVTTTDPPIQFPSSLLTPLLDLVGLRPPS
ncbi:hypothetical protein CBL_11304 [Carabus blaptoides fortunei]